MPTKKEIFTVDIVVAKHIVATTDVPAFTAEEAEGYASKLVKFKAHKAPSK